MIDSKTTVYQVPFKETELLYEATNSDVKWRIDSLFKKEPDTIAWLSQIKENEIFFDIGANVGMYSIIAAKSSKAQVYAFEPESQNYALLMRNIMYNELQNSCTAYCMALSDEHQFDKLYLSSFSTGGSCHTFGDNLDYHLQQRKNEIIQGSISFPLDNLIEQYELPRPNHIKIDVDGLEHKVIQGALKTIQHDSLHSILIELNTHLKSHVDIIEMLKSFGFIYDQRQVDLFIRKEGHFSGIGNFIFYKNHSGINFDRLVEEHQAKPATQNNSSPEKIFNLDQVLHKLKNMEVSYSPYPHFYIEDFFDEDFYSEIIKMKPNDDELTPLNQTGRATRYENRLTMHLEQGLDKLKSNGKRVFWENFRTNILSNEIIQALTVSLREAFIQQGMSKLAVYPEAMFMRDLKGYSIGPHTDHPQRVLSIMFYLPDDEQHSHLGTSVYTPLENGFTCSGTSHYDFPGFNNIKTAAYKPNSIFGFFKTNNSFHGVEEMKDDYKRDTMVYIIKHSD